LRRERQYRGDEASIGAEPVGDSRQRGENEEAEKINRQLLLDFNLGTCISEIE
jgi:hypothetical protein